MKRLTNDHFALTVNSTRSKIVQAVLAAQTGMARLSLEQNNRITRLSEMQNVLEEDLAGIIKRGKVRVRVKKVTTTGKGANKTTKTEWIYKDRELALEEKMQLLAIINRSVEVLMTMLERVNKPVMDFGLMERFLREVEDMRTGTDGATDMQKFIEHLPPDMARELDRQLRADLQDVVDADFTEVPS